jgi:UDP-sugar transporter A1/2/3
MASVWAKYCALAVFVLQNAGVILLMRYSKIVDNNGSGVAYSTAVVVLMQECVKLPICLVLHAMERGGPNELVAGLAADLRINRAEWLLLSIPALLFTVQNNALFLGLANLEAAVAQVTYQTKIFTTALFSVCLLGRRLSTCQWIALLLLVVGVLCVQGVPEQILAGQYDHLIAPLERWFYAHVLGRAKKVEHRSIRDAYRKAHLQHQREQAAAAAAAEAAAQVQAAGGSPPNVYVGVCAMLVACVCSSFAGVFFEMMLKRSSSSLWLRNIQLGVFATAIAALTVLFQQDDLMSTHGFFHGFGALTWIVVASNAFGGLLVAVTIKYADNILRGFAQALALIVGSLGSLVLFEFSFTRDFVIGVVLVIGMRRPGTTSLQSPHRNAFRPHALAHTYPTPHVPSAHLARSALWQWRSSCTVAPASNAPTEPSEFALVTRRMRAWPCP